MDKSGTVVVLVSKKTGDNADILLFLLRFTAP